MEPITLHPDNPHYFLFRAKPTVLITSGEHYGAVLNLDFDYLPYLDELQACGFNLTRLFTGAYCEHPEAFNIENNTLAPAPGRFICPWARSDVHGYAGGGSKFDLSRWDDAYLRRLHDFCRQAGRRGIVIEVVLFCPYYQQEQWELSPLKASSNVNDIGDVPKDEVLTLNHPDLVALQEAMVRKVVSELNGYDNIYFEVCNEPYFGGVTSEWQDRIIAAIVETEAPLPSRHLIAQNIANGSQEIRDPNPAVSLFNFHYASPPDSLAQNYPLNRPIAFDETGFKGTADLPYRTEGWEFILAGGAVYSNLDYSFTAQNPDGIAPVKTSPGGGGPTLRRQLKILKEFIDSFDFVHLRPDPLVIRGELPPEATARVLAEAGRAYAIYLKGGSHADLTLEIPAGRYRAEWVNPQTGNIDKEGDIEHSGGRLTLSSPTYTEDVALRIVS